MEIRSEGWSGCYWLGNLQLPQLQIPLQVWSCTADHASAGPSGLRAAAAQSVLSFDVNARKAAAIDGADDQPLAQYSGPAMPGPRPGTSPALRLARPPWPVDRQRPSSSESR